MVEVSLTVGKLDASLALLLTKDHHLIEFPTILLPNGVKAGSIVKIRCEQDFDTERAENESFQKVQDEILSTFGKSLPHAPVLKVKNVTQTSCVLEWEALDLGTASLKNLILFKDGKKLGSIPQPLTNRTTKLSGLPIDKTFEVQVKLDTTAGIYASDTLEVTTHKMTDLSGITVCLGDLLPNDPFDRLDIELTLASIGARPCQDKVQVDTTHFICTRENKGNPEYLKAQDMNIPIIRPEWLKACERERRIVGVTAFYLKECVLPDILAKNYWEKSGEKSVPAQNSVPSIVEEQVEKSESKDAETSAEADSEAKEAQEQLVESTNVSVEQSVPEKSEEKEGTEPDKSEETATSEAAEGGENTGKPATEPAENGGKTTGEESGTTPANDAEMEEVDLNKPNEDGDKEQNEDGDKEEANAEIKETLPEPKPELELADISEISPEQSEVPEQSEAPQQPEPETVSKEELEPNETVAQASGETEATDITEEAGGETNEPAETGDASNDDDSQPQDTTTPPKSQQKKKKKKKGKKWYTTINDMYINKSRV